MNAFTAWLKKELDFWVAVSQMILLWGSIFALVCVAIFAAINWPLVVIAIALLLMLLK